MSYDLFTDTRLRGRSRCGAAKDPNLFAHGAAVLIKVFSRFLDRIEGYPITPYGHFSLPARQFDRCVAMVFVTFIILRTKIVFGHFLILL
jgi:hypothetical protein